ncbi:MAG: protease pro-enzyme activation domain-containing protein [Terracidiphilus sp.]
MTAQSFTPTTRIVDKIDESQLVTLKGNTHPYANAKNDRGRVSPDLPMTDLILVLSRDPAQQAAFEQFVASQYDSSSPNFHKWLTPQQVGENFGPSETDIATITNWLTGHGFTVDEIPSDHMSIRFSGKASQVESTFHTEMHNLEVKSVAHIGNMSDPQIPAALASAVIGVKSLHNFFPRPLHHMGAQVSRDAATGKWKRNASTSGARPLFGINVPASNGNQAYQVEDVSPYDFATIYNVLPLWSAGTDGTGQTIAIAGTSSINLADVSNFRNEFGLPTTNSYNTPILQSGNGEPLTMCTTTSSTASCTLDDLVENSLDVEWSGAVAKNAQIILVSSAQASLSDDPLYDSESFIVQNHTAPIMNVSYGACELFNGTAGNVEYYNLWQTAYAEGIAVFVAAGDSGSASCDDGMDAQFGVPWVAEYGLSVSGLASTPYNVAVGGTDFNWCPLLTIWNGGECSPAPYWNSTNTSVSAGQSSAKGYIPELPWNDTCTSPLALGFLGAYASDEYGVSGIDNAEEACNFVVDYAFNFIGDIYQNNSGLLGIVDTVGGSGGASGCVVNDGSDVISCVSTTTSTGATTNPDTGAAQVSIPLYNDGWPKPIWQTGVSGIPSDGVRDIPDVSFFASDGFLSSSAYLICVSEGGYTCTYNTNTEPVAQEVGGTSVATPAMAGVMALINQKTGSIQGNPNAELYKLASQQTYSNCSAETATTSNSCYFNDIDQGTNAMACDYGANIGISPNCLPPEDKVGGNVDEVGILSGYSAGVGYDQATGLGSLNVANVVNSFEGIGNHPATLTVTPASYNITANQTLNVTISVTAAFAGGPTPTGTVILSSGSYNSGPQTLSTSGSCTAAGCTIAIPGDSLNPGTAVILKVNYSGDSTYASQSNTAIVTVTQLLPKIQVSAASTLNSNYPLPVTVTLSGTGGTPTGTVTLSAPGYTSSAVTLNASGVASFTIPADTFTAITSGSITLSASYSGDASYTSNTGSATVTVTYVPVLFPTVTVAPASSTVNSNASLNVTATVTGASTSEASPTGTVTLSGGGLTPTLTGTLSGGSYIFTIPPNSLNPGVETLTVTYSGDPFYYPGTGTGNVTVSESTFSLEASATTAIANPGGSATSTITATAIAGYTGTATLTACTLVNYTPGDADLPTCSLSGTTLTMGGAGVIATVSTTSSNSSLAYPKMPGKGRGWEGAGGGALLASLLFLGIPARRRGWRSMLGILVVMAALGSLSACGSSSSSTSGGTGTTPDNYIFMVTATGNPSVAPAPSVTFSVVVN